MNLIKKDINQYPREPSAVFQLALLGKASTADISITRRLVDAGKILGITVDDHIIITQSGYLSLNDEGLI